MTRSDEQFGVKGTYFINLDSKILGYSRFYPELLSEYIGGIYPENQDNSRHLQAKAAKLFDDNANAIAARNADYNPGNVNARGENDDDAKR